MHIRVRKPLKSVHRSTHYCLHQENSEDTDSSCGQNDEQNQHRANPCCRFVFMFFALAATIVILFETAVVFTRLKHTSPPAGLYNIFPRTFFLTHRTLLKAECVAKRIIAFYPIVVNGRLWL